MEDGGLRAVGDAHLPVDALEVALDGAFGDGEGEGDLAVAAAGGDEREDLGFTRSQRVAVVKHAQDATARAGRAASPGSWRKRVRPNWLGLTLFSLQTSPYRVCSCDIT